MYIIMIAIIFAVLAFAITWAVQQYFDGFVFFIAIAFALIGSVVGICTYDFAFEKSCEGAEIISCEELIELVPVTDTAGEYLRIVGADELKYLYSYETEEGIQKATLNLDDAVIQYVSKGEKARLVIVKYFFANKFRNRLFSLTTKIDYTFYIPKDSIIN